MKRRAFFGFLGGAAAAGPTLAKSLAEEASTMRMPMPGIGYASGREASASDGDWKLRQIARLKAVISGKDPQAQQSDVMDRLYSAEGLERYRLDALRSVSPTYRMQMLISGAPARRDRIRRTDAKFDLARILRGD